jgi:spore coat protein H
MQRFLGCLVLVGLCGGVLAAELPGDAAELFDLKKVWSARLSLSADQWKELKPEEPEGGFPFGPPGGGGPGRRGGFGPGTFLAGPLVARLDVDQNGSVTKEEFVGGFEGFFVAWDSEKSGSLNEASIRAGLNKDLAPQFPPLGGGGRPGGPGAPAGGGPGGPGGPGGFNLQGRAGGRNGLSAARGIVFDYVHAGLVFESKRLEDVAVRYKGNGTYMDARQTDKKSFKVDLNEFTKGQKLAGVSKLNFHNNITDAGLMNEPLAHALYRDAGVPAARSTYVRLTLDAAGAHTNRYLGVYSIVENPDNNWAEDRFGTKKGLILKPVTRELFKYQGDDWSAYQQAYDPKTEITPAQRQRVFDFAKLVTDGSDEELARRLPEFLDIDEFTRFMAVTVWLSNTDSILMVGQNYVLYLHPKTQKFSFVPWDLDRAFGNFFTPSPTEMSIRNAWAEDNRFLKRVMAVEAVRSAYLARMEEFQKTLFRPERLKAQVDELAKILRPAVEAEKDPSKLERFDQVVSGQAPQQQGFGFRTGQTIKGFVTARHQSVADQLAGKSEGIELAGGPGGPGGRRGPGGPGGPRGGGFPGPGEFWTGIVIKESDGNADGKVTAAEFRQLAEKWFKAWDESGTGVLKQEDVAAGLNKLMPEFRPPGGG